MQRSAGHMTLPAASQPHLFAATWKMNLVTTMKYSSKVNFGEII